MGTFFSRLSPNYRWVVLLAIVVDWIIFLIWLISQWFGYDFQLAIYDSILSNVVLLGVSFLMISIFLRYLPRDSKFLYAIGLSFILAGFCECVTRETLLQFVTDEGYIAFLEKSLPVRWTIGFLMMTGVSLITVFYQQLEKQQEAIKREAYTAAMMKEAELQKLQTQLQPHFLFNSLNSINAMIFIKPEEAKGMVEQLSEFLRTTTKRADQQWVMFEEEWSYLELYLAIEKVRFGHRLEVKTNFQQEVLSTKIPTLLLQPLVENAVKYGLYGTTGSVVIDVHASADNHYFQFSISNPYEKDMLPPTGSGFGLQGLRRRLYLLFAQNDLLQTSQTDRIFTVTLKIPKQV